LSGSREQKNTLADALSRLIEITPEAAPEVEPDGQEFGTYCFEELETAKVNCVYTERVMNIDVTDEVQEEVQLPLKWEQLIRLQKADATCREIVRKLKKDRATAKNISTG